MRKFYQQTLFAILISSLCFNPAYAQDHKLNLQDAQIQTLIATVSEITGKNFVIDPRVTGPVTVISNQPMTEEQIYEIFLSVLKVHGFAAVPSGDYIKIVPEGFARTDTIPNAFGQTNFANDALITEVLSVKHVQATEIVPLLRPLIPQNGNIIAHPGSNLLVISDRAGNINRLRQIVRRVDTASEDDVEVIALQHANATEVVRTLNLLEPSNPQANTSTKAIADERTNSVLLNSDPGSRLRMRTLISHLDTPLESGGSTQVIYLRYASAESLVPILEQVSRNESGGTEAAASVTSVQAHPETNALIISAPPAVYRTLTGIIRQLDIRRHQVLVEAIIAEVTSDFGRELGIQWQAANIDSINDSGIIGGTNFPTSNRAGIIGVSPTDNGLLNLGGLGAGLNLGYLSGAIQIGTDANGNPIEVPQLSALATALDNNAQTNVLSTPSIVTLDNQEAVINVGQEVPFLTGQFTNTGTDNASVNPFQTINRENVGLTLTVTPHINEGDTVILEISQEVSSLTPQTGAVDLITSTREISTTVMVPDNGILVLGGLIDEDVRETVQKVPGLGSIPLVGNLFKYRTSDRVKRNLMVFIRPIILRDHASANAVTGAKYRHIRDNQIQAKQQYDGLLDREQLPILPDLQEYLKSTQTENSAGNE